MLRKSSGPLRPWRRLRARRAASLRVSGYSALLQRSASRRATACMNSTSSGSGLRSVLAIASTPRSATSRRRISASISFLNCSMRLVVLVVLEPLLERRQLAADLLAAGLHQLLEHRVEVEVPQRAVQVVRAADRPAGLHAGEALHGLAGQGPHHAPRRRSSAPGRAAGRSPRA